MVGGGFVEGGQLKRAHLYVYRITAISYLPALLGPLVDRFLGTIRAFRPHYPPERNGGELSAVDSEVKPKALRLSGSLDDSRLKLRQEPAKLGDDPGFEDMPVEEFAAAYLRGERGGKERQRGTSEIDLG